MFFSRLDLILNDVLGTIMLIKKTKWGKKQNKTERNKNLWDGPLRMEVEWNGANINPFSVTKETEPKLESGKRF